MRHGVGTAQARQIHSDFEEALAWDYHYWLHRGALELENDNLDVAENFLNQAKSINGTDVYIDNELAYLSLKKANQIPAHPDSAKLVEDAIETLDDIVSACQKMDICMNPKNKWRFKIAKNFDVR